MPELPEVETVRRMLEAHVVGRSGGESMRLVAYGFGQTARDMFAR